MNEHHEVDTLISRVVAYQASEIDFDRLDALIEQQPDSAGQLVEALRLETQLSRSAADLSQQAMHVDLPVENVARQRKPVPLIGQTTRHLGWLCAAMIAIAWIFVQFLPVEPSSRLTPVETRPISAQSLPTFDEAFSDYLRIGRQDGRIVGELDSIMVEMRPINDGQQLEVLYLRRVLERDIVDEALQLAADEFGRPTTVPLRVNTSTTHSSL